MLKEYVLLLVVAVYSCPGQQIVCYKGVRKTVAGSIVSNQFSGDSTCTKTEGCFSLKIDHQEDDKPAITEYASCVSYLSTLPCDISASFFGVRSSTPNCSMSSCNSFACNQFSPSEGCSAEAPAGDTQILPNCTLRESLKELSHCLSPYINELPYTDGSKCSYFGEMKYSGELVTWLTDELVTKRVRKVSSASTTTPSFRSRYTYEAMSSMSNAYDLTLFAVVSLCEDVSNMESSYICVRKMVHKCLSGTCPTVLDPLPYDLRAIYSQLSSVLAGSPTMFHFLASLNISDSVIDQVLNQTCFLTINPYLRMWRNLTLDQYLFSPGIPPSQLGNVISNPVCGMSTPFKLIERAFSEVQLMPNDMNHERFCRSMSDLWDAMATTWRTQCNKTETLSLFGSMLPPAYSPLYPEIMKAIEIAEEVLFNTSRLPGCEVMTSQVTHAPIVTTTALSSDDSEVITAASITSAVPLDGEISSSASASASGLDGKVVCYGGIRKTIEGVVSWSRHETGITCNETQGCSMIKIDFQEDQNAATSEFASCGTPMSALPCDVTASYLGVRSSSPQCSYKSCNTFACNQFTPPKGCSTEARASDIQILPKCTLRETLRGLLSCLSPYIGSFPYKKQGLCINNIESSYSCVQSMVINCSSGSCLTMTDSLPFELRSKFAQLFSDLRNSPTLVHFVINLNVSISAVEEYLNQVCLLPTDPYILALQIMQLDEFLALLGITTAQLGNSISNPVCDSTVLIELMQRAFLDTQLLLTAKSHDSFCRSMSDLWDAMATTWRTQCNKTETLSLIGSMLPPAYSPLYPEIMKAIEIAEEVLFNTSRLPGCEDAVGSVVPTTVLTSASASETSSSTSTAAVAQSSLPSKTSAASVTSQATDEPASSSAAPLSDAPAVIARVASQVTARARIESISFQTTSGSVSGFRPFWNALRIVAFSFVYVLLH